jgi:hypothetical protein
MSGPSLLPIVLKGEGGHVFSMSFVFIYAYWCPTRFPHHMMFVSHNSTMMGATSGEGTVHPSGEPDFTSVCIAQSLVFFVLFCRSLFVFLSCFYWSLYFTSND